MLYDGLLVAAIWMAGTTVVVICTNQPVDSGNPLFQLYLMALAFAYFHISWSRKRQTLGMRAWRIRLDPGAAEFSVLRSLRRFVAGLVSLLVLGLGFAWALTRSDRRAWPDIASASRLVVLTPVTRASGHASEP